MPRAMNTREGAKKVEHETCGRPQVAELCLERKDHPQSNAEPAEIERKLSLLARPSIQPLTDFVRELRVARPDAWIPWVDSTEAGIDARILRLMEAPGGKAVEQRGGSGFVSADNDDV